MSSNKPVTPETLKSELTTLLVTAHGDIKKAAEEISRAVDELIEAETPQNKEMLMAAVMQAMSVSKLPHFKVADEQVQQALMNILVHAKEVIEAGLNDSIALNELIKQEQKRLKMRIQQVEEETRRRGLGR